LAELGGHDFTYVAGNHDPYRIMRGLLDPDLRAGLVRRLELRQDGRSYLVTHGHRWSIDWGFLGLRHVAPHIVEFMVDYLPRTWRWFCRRMGWLASERPDGESQPREDERITRLTRIVWEGASSHALKNGRCVVVGHTHTTGRRERGVSGAVGTETYMVDGGDLPDGSYVEITSDAGLAWLPRQGD
jgi:predicted phosphodiesterase